MGWLSDISLNTVYLEKKQGPKVHSSNKFRDITNTFSLAVCLFRDETNPALQG
jgi:hypothetical protein